MIQEKEYASRRKKLLAKMKKNSVALICAAMPKKRSNDTEYPYRQNSNFYYLCGFKEDNAALVFVKTKRKTKTILFVQPKDPQMELWSGKRLGVKAAKKRFLVDKVLPISKLEEKLKKCLEKKVRAYYEFGSDNPAVERFAKMTHSCYTRHNLSKVIESMRLVKSETEIALIKKALEITKEAHHQAIRLHKEGMTEYQLQANFEYVFKKNGAYSDAYTTIVAGGDNANTLHYVKNDQPLRSGDLVLIDAGCEYDYYASDITRTIPVSGTFSKAQKEVYALVLDVEKKIISMVKEGMYRSELQKEAERMLCEGMVRLGILKGDVQELLKKKAHKRYFPHSIGHYMGLDVHDQNPYKTKNFKEIPLKAGMVLTIEPGLYLPKEDRTVPKKFRGIGIRIEDDILVKKNGCENLSSGIVKEIEEIEAYTKGS